MFLELKKKSQLNLSELQEKYPEAILSFNIIGLSVVDQFIVEENWFIFYLYKNRVKDFERDDKSYFLVFHHGKTEKIEIDSQYIRNQESELYEEDWVDIVFHRGNILVFVTERKKVVGNHFHTENRVRHILIFDPKDLRVPKVIEPTNIIEASTKKERKGECRPITSIQKVYQSDSDEFPAIVGYGKYGEYHINIIKINFNTLSAEWLFTKHEDSICLPLSDVCSFIESQEALDMEEPSNAYSYTTALDQMIFDRLLIKQNKIFFFSIGSRKRFRKYGMYRYIFLGELQQQNNRKYKLSKIHKKAFFDAKDYEWELGISFGRDSIFASSHKHVIINPVYKSSDPWGYREKIYDFESEILYDVKFPRGFKKHRIFDIKDNQLISIGENSKSQSLITYFDIVYNKDNNV